MGAFKLETFEVASGSSGLKGIRNSVLERERNEAYAKGFKDGVDVTTTAVDVERNRRLATIDEALADLVLTHESASVSIQRSIAPMIGAFLNAIAPALAESGLIAMIGDRLETILRESNKGAIIVKASPNTVDALAAELQARTLEVSIESDGSLRDDVCAELHWAGGVDEVSVQWALEELSAQIHTYNSQFEEGKDNDRHSA